jgi:peptidyl-prolyl cis-trans isomerase D
VLQSMRSTGAKYLIWIVLVAVPFVFIFLFYQTSGLSSRGPATATSTVASVNGEEISLIDWQRVLSQREQEANQRLGRQLTLDEQKQLEQNVFDELVDNILLDQELARRHIGVTDAEIIEAARTSPPPDLMNAPQLQTDGKFDEQKYLRFLSSPMAKEEGLLTGLEAFYRQQIPREKLSEQIAAGVFVSDEQLWSLWRDTHDSAQISFVRFVPDSAEEAAAVITDADLRSYYDQHHDELTRKGQAVVSIVMLPKVITHADSAATLAHLLALRAQIEKGANFADIAKQQSSDSASAIHGGSLGWGKHGRFVPEFESAAWALKPGQVSGPVLTPFGYHLIKMDSARGDSALFSHILLRIQQSDSSAALLNARADSLERLGAQAETPEQFDHAIKVMGLTPSTVHVTEETPLFWNGHQVPSVGTWAFGGAKVGESSELYEGTDGFYLARLDSLTPGGLPSFAAAEPTLRRLVAVEKAQDALVAPARQLATQAAATSLEQAAKAAKLPVVTTPVFTPTGYVPDVGRMNEVVGAAFGLPVGAISSPIETSSDVFVIHVDRRVPTDSAAWVKQKDTQRQNVLRDLRRQRVDEFLTDLHEVARIVDNRKAIEAATQKAST